MICKEVKNANSCSLVRRDEVFSPRNKNTFLPNNTLTLQIQILKKGAIFKPYVPLLRAVCTRVQENRQIDIWEILNFCSIRLEDWSIGFAKKFPPMTQYDLFLTLHLCLDDKGRFKFSLFTISGSSLESAFATCKVKSLDATGKKYIFAESEFYFGRNHRVWQFTSYITNNMLLSDRNLFLPDGTLTLMIECILPSPSTNHVADSVNQSSNSTPSKTVDKSLNGNINVHDPSNTLSRDLLKLFETGILSDFNLSAGDATFPVHKQVLSARSPVFQAMFTTDMKEQESEGIAIQDMDADTLQRMIKFIYTDEVQESLEWNEISKLYAAADRYQLLFLRNRCASLLKLRVCVSNVCEIHALADLYQDEDLASTTLDFMIRNDTQIIGSEPWKKLEKENPYLTCETFRALYLKKMDKE